MTKGMWRAKVEVSPRNRVCRYNAAACISDLQMCRRSLIESDDSHWRNLVSIDDISSVTPVAVAYHASTWSGSRNAHRPPRNNDL